MKIGIVTFWQSGDNYGQQLQCWALQRYLRGLGHEPFLIRYSGTRSAMQRWLRKAVKAALVYPLVAQWKRREIRRMIAVNEVKNKIRRFDEFKDRHIERTERIYRSLSELRQNPPIADVYIAGSDQVWNPILLKRKENRVFWLDFGDDKVRRIAYAASYGADTCPPELQDELSRRLSRFDAVSVREESGVAICHSSGREATHVLDPTLLLSMDDYLPLTENVADRPSPYIYVYSINIADKEDIRWSELQTFAGECGLSSVVTPASGYLPGRELFDGVEYCYATIPQWLSLIRHSNLVVTTSFHGVAFCLLFRKRFVYFPLSGIHSKGNSRVLNLLSKLGLSDCVWKAAGDFKRIYNLSIDWNKVEEALTLLRRKSFSFLQQALS